MRAIDKFYSIGVKIFLALGCISLVLLAYGTWSIRAVTEAGEIVRETYDKPFQALNYALKANARLNQMRVIVRDGGDTTELELLFLEDLEIAEDRVLSEEARQQVGSIREEFDQWREAAHQAPSSALELELADTLATSFDVLTETMTLDSFRERQRALGAVSDSRRLAIFAVSAAMVLAVVLSLLMSRQIARPLRIAAKAAEQVSRGDFQVPLPTGRRDETGALLSSMRVMQASIKTMLEREEARTRSAEVRMADALENAGSAILIHDREGRLIFANSQVSGFFSGLLSSEGGSIRAGGVLKAEFLAEIADGREVELSQGRWLSTSRSVTRDGETIVIWTDISALKGREAALREAKEAAQAAAVAKSNFLANMSHEIRTPMNGVLGISEVLQSTDLDDRQEELVSLIRSSGTNLMAVINSILDFSKLEAGKVQLSETGFNLRRTVSEVGAMMQATVHQKGIELSVQYAPDLPEGVRGDETRIRQVLGNLVGNAVKFTHKGHVLIAVDGAAAGETANIKLTIRDTGIGISEDDLPRMFQKFEQADGSKSRHFEGTGLGLAICKELIELMGGTIRAESTLGKGSCFTIDLALPIEHSVQSLQQTDDHSSISSPSRTADERPGKARELEAPTLTSEDVTCRILIAEDNVVNQMVMTSMLAAPQIKLAVAENGQIALELFEAERFDLVITDLSMPVMDGLTAARKIRALETGNGWTRTPIIAATAHVLESDREDVRNAGIDDFIGKPLKKDQLLALIAKWSTARRMSSVDETKDKRRI